jgi:hypothetical protein
MAFLATQIATELRELQVPGGLEWQRPVPPQLASSRSGIARSVLSGKGGCHRPEMITDCMQERLA